MDWKFSNEFFRDLEIYNHDKGFINQLFGKIKKEIEKANSIEDVLGMENIRGRKVFYRFKITSGKIVYRIAIKVLHNKVWFTIIDTHKKRFYERI